ncbi:hypothetical protein B0T17DRAFT_76112 [Bombardia bombarda]|uniref:FHA domain-containing protein n=1 Tax=Bombardia bombarda TaxID=252184 RepID=A0AA39XLN3_9PEZI|nr:hypothetical protein B0T17DRAFT_76112 [Bombardia bombarda]
MAASAGSAAKAVQVSLSMADMSASDALFPERRIMLDQDKDSIAIGRASKVQSKGFVEGKDNGWFSSPVMSRQHAEIVAELGERKIKIRDRGSLHGTYINDNTDRLPKDELRELQDGDRLKFGVPIWRGSEDFAPTSLTVGIKYHEHDDHGQGTNTYHVPEGSDDGSDDDDDYSSDDSRSVKENTEPAIAAPKTSTGSNAPHVIDLTQKLVRSSPQNASGSEIMPGTGNCEIIDLSSPSRSPLFIEDDDDDSDSVIEIPDDCPESAVDIESSPSPQRAASPELNVTSDTLAILSDFRGQLRYARSISDYDNDSLHLSTDDDERSMSGESQESMSDNESDGSSSDLDSDASSSIDDNDRGIDIDTAFDEFDEDIPSDAADYSSENEIYDDEQMDEAPSVVTFWVAPSVHADSPRITAHHEAATAMPHFGSAHTKGTAAVSIGGLLNEYKIPPYQPSARPGSSLGSLLIDPTVESSLVFKPAGSLIARQASPSDAAMPKSYIRGPSDSSRPPIAAVTLGEKYGKSDFFEAREQNKISPNLQKVNQPRASISVHALCNKDGPFVYPKTRTTGVLAARATIEELGKTSEQASTDQFCHLVFHKPTSSQQPIAPDMTLASEAVEPSQTIAAPAVETSTEVDTGLSPPEALVDRATPSPECEESTGNPLFSGHQMTNVERTHGLQDHHSLLPAPDTCHRQTNMGIPDILADYQPSTDKVKGKRKAEEISDVSHEDLGWEACEKSDSFEGSTEVPPFTRPIFASSAIPSVAPPSTEMSSTDALWKQTTTSALEKLQTDLARQASMTMASQDGRPTKRLRRVAERVAYAALGGVTAGAMIFGTLILTAPSFA